MFTRDLSAPSIASALHPVRFRPSRLALSRLGLTVVLAALLVGIVSLAEAAPRKTAKAKSRGNVRVSSGAETHTGAAAEAVAASKIALLDFHGERTEQIRAQVLKVLKTKVREVSSNLRPPDTAEQYRDMGAALDLALYVHGQIKDMGKDQSVLTIDLRSGVNGRKLTSVKFTGSRSKLYADAEDELWKRIEKPFGRACLEATRAVRHHNAPMRIEAGTPIEDSSARSSL
jgi:hypothetical protein